MLDRRCRLLGNLESTEKNFSHGSCNKILVLEIRINTIETNAKNRKSKINNDYNPGM